MSETIAKKAFGFLRVVSIFRVRGTEYNGVTLELSQSMGGKMEKSMNLYFEDKKRLDDLILMLVEARISWENESDA